MRARVRVRPVLLVAALAAALTLTAASSAQASSVVEHTLTDSGTQYRSAMDFWTKERLREAKPMPLPEMQAPTGAARADGPVPSKASSGGGAKPIYMEGQAPTIGPLARQAEKRNKLPKHPKFRSGAVPVAAYGAAPFRSNGKLYMKFGAKLYTCSATVVPSKTHTVILTAGHCIFNKKQGGFATQVVFFPGYFGGRTRHGFWVGTKIVTNGEWTKRTNEKFDYAAIKTAGPQGPIGSVVGESGLALNAGRRHKELTLGYPNNLGKTQVMWGCSSRLIGDDPYNHGRGKKNIAIGCNMSHGCSGGSWEIKRHKRFYVNSVSSYFYKTKRFNNILFGPYLTKHAKKVVHRANKG